MDIITKLEKTNKKIHTIWENASRYCAGKPCVRCLLDNGRGLCTANLMALIERNIKKLKNQEDK